MSLPDVYADQNHAVGRFFQSVNELSEILVLRQQDAAFTKGSLQDFIIGDACLLFGHIEDIVTGRPETGHDARVTALIGKKFHVSTRYPKAICSSAR